MTIITMAMPILISFFFACFVFSNLKESYAFEGRKIAESQQPQYHLQDTHLIQVSSLVIPSTSCKPSTKVFYKKASLKVVHKHGPCYQEKGNSPTHKEIFLEDQSRVKAINSRLSNALIGSGGVRNNSSSGSRDMNVTDAANLPAKDGRTIGSGNYIVTVGLGQPKKDLSLVFDTGSDLTWTQCEPCVKYCYNQKDPIFNPSQSTTYTNVSCSSLSCSSLNSATGNSPSCSSSTCVYSIQYGDSSFSIGFLGIERLTLTPTNVFDNFYFGCGQNNKGLFTGSAGLLGLGRNKLSAVSQTAQKFNKIFSYCLPSSSSSTGFLTFGGSFSKSAKFTPLSTKSAGSSFYGLDFIAISVKGQRLPISNSVFSNAGAIIDSGTVITRLPPVAYSALRSAFRKEMSQYPMAPALSILDTCYDFSNYNTITVPKIGFFFNGGVEVDIDQTGVFYVNNIKQVCLAFAGNSDDTEVLIFGNVQQKTLEVVYDDSAGRVGFASGGCS